MSEFVYLYRGGSMEGAPEEMQKVMQKWMAWFKQLGEKGHIKNPGHPLERTGKLVKGSQKTVTDGPFAESKDVVGGYTLIDPASNFRVAGERWELSAEDVIDICENMA